jgi:hypothetical protein
MSLKITGYVDTVNQQSVADPDSGLALLIDNELVRADVYEPAPLPHYASRLISEQSRAANEACSVAVELSKDQSRQKEAFEAARDCFFLADPISPSMFYIDGRWTITSFPRGSYNGHFYFFPLDLYHSRYEKISKKE